MRKTIKVSALTVLAAAGLAGCVKQDWQVTYNGGSNVATGGQSIAKDSAGNVYISGQSLSSGETSEGAFVAAYSPTGNQLWSYAIPSGVNEYAERVAVDTSGNVYLEILNLSSVAMMYKFDAKGTLVNSWQMATKVSFLDDIKIGPDQNVYVSLNSGSQLLAYSGLGDLLWQHSNVQSTASTPGASGSASVMPHYGELGFDNGQVLQASATGVTLFDTQGQVKSTLTATALGMTEVTSMTAVAGGVDLLANDSSQLELVRLDSDLNVISSTAVGKFEGDARIANMGSNLCVESAPRTDTPIGGATIQYHVYGFTPNATQLFDTVMTTGNVLLWGAGKLDGNAAGCDFNQIYESSNAPAMTTKLTHVSSTGKVINGIQNKNTLIQDFLLSGNDVFEVGTKVIGNSASNAVLMKYTRY